MRIPTRPTPVDKNKRTPRFCPFIHRGMSESMQVRIVFCYGCPFGQLIEMILPRAYNYAFREFQPRAGVNLFA
jgi:hypothetical protein